MSGQHQEDLNEKARRYREGEQSAPPNGHREPSEKLSPQHRRELEASAIDQAVWEERGYETIQRPDSGDTRPRQRLKSYGIPNWAIKEDWNFPGLIIPMYGPTGRVVSCQWKPRTPIAHNGKLQKYASPRGIESRLDVHPRWTRLRHGIDPGQPMMDIQDPKVELWITEGVKKADSLTSRGCCTIALTGVYNCGRITAHWVTGKTSTSRAARSSSATTPTHSSSVTCC